VENLWKTCGKPVENGFDNASLVQFLTFYPQVIHKFSTSYGPHDQPNLGLTPANVSAMLGMVLRESGLVSVLSAKRTVFHNFFGLY
jgi:hypothetical protein